ncbi:Filamin B, beta (actin binding protein 278) [Balamuthia mandrillaris]
MGTFVNEEVQSITLCNNFCADLYDSCQSATFLPNPNNDTVGSLFNTPEEFCATLVVGGYETVVLSGEEEGEEGSFCFRGREGESVAANVEYSGRGAFRGFSGLEYCLTVQTRDVFDNDRLLGGDEITLEGRTTEEEGEPSQLVFGEVVDNGNGHYDVCYRSSAPGVYTIEASVNGKVGPSIAVELAEGTFCPIQEPRAVEQGQEVYYPNRDEDLTLCKDFSETSCCSREDTEAIEEYMTSVAEPLFEGFPECLANLELMICGLTCDPRQSIYVTQTANATSEGDLIFHMCSDFCDAFFESCKDAEIQPGFTVGDSFDGVAESFCIATSPTFLPSPVTFVVEEDSLCWRGLPNDVSACDSYVYGEGSQSAVAGEDAAMFIQAVDRFGELRTSSHRAYTWEVLLRGPTTTTPALSVEDNLDGTYTVRYRVEEAGRYDIDITLVRLDGTLPNREAFCETPELAVVATEPDISRYIAFNGPPPDGTGLEFGFADIPETFQIQGKDRFGNNVTVGGTEFAFEMVGPRGVTQTVVADDPNTGLYTATYTADLGGQYNLTITSVEGEPIENPFHTPFVFPSEVFVAYGPGISDAQSACPNGEGIFFIQEQDRQGNNATTGGFFFDISIRNRDTGELLASNAQDNIDCRPELCITDNNDGTYTVTYSTTDAGDYVIDVAERQTLVPIKSSPFLVFVRSGPIHSDHTAAYGDFQVTACSINYTITVFGRDICNNPATQGGDAELLEIIFEGPGVVENPVNYTLTDNDDGTYTIEYFPFRTGTYILNILIGGEHIQGSPFSIDSTIDDLIFDPTNSIILGDGITSQRVCITNLDFLVEARDRCGNTVPILSEDLVVVITVVPNDLAETVVIVPFEMTYIGNGFHEVTYYPYYAGDYTFTAAYGGVSVVNSPLEVYMPPGPAAPNTTKASGLGISRASSARINLFDIAAFDGCENTIADADDQLVIELSENKVPIPNFLYNLTNHGDGTYTVSYTASSSGCNDLAVQVNDPVVAHIEGSPFSVQFEGIVCAPDPDCGGYGACVEGVCICRPGYTGISCNTTVPSPELAIVKWSNTGAYIIFYFDRATDRAASVIDAGPKGVFDCDQLVIFESGTAEEALGKDSFCYWESDSVLIAATGSGETVTTGQNVAIVENAVRARALNSGFANTSDAIHPPDFSPVPRVSIVVPQIVSECEAVVMDASGSTGTGGRPFVNGLDWELVEATGEENNADVIGATLDATNDTAVNLLDLPIPGSQYLFQATATNFHEQTAFGQVSVQKSGLAVPNVMIEGPRVVHTTSDKDLTLKGSATLTCAEDPAVTFSFSWTIIDAPEGAPLDPVLSITPLLVIPRGTFLPDSIYKIRFTAARGGASGQSAVNYQDVTIVVGKSPVQGFIAPGSRRVARQSAIVLDASAAIPIDRDPEELEFLWACHLTSDPEVPCMSEALEEFYFGPRGPVVEFLPSTFFAGFFTFKLEVRDLHLVGRACVEFNDTTPPIQDEDPLRDEIVIQVVQSQIPLVQITPLAYGRANANEGFNLEGIATARTPILAYQWSMFPEFTPLAEIAQTSTTSPVLVIPPNALTPGLKYTFTLEAISRDGIGYSTLTVLINQPPLSGNFEAEILEDDPELAFVTVKLTASLWEDEEADYPWTYLFVAGADEVPLSQPSLSNVLVANVARPQFPGPISLFLYVTDAYGASFRKELFPPLEVEPVGLDSCPGGRFEDGSCQLVLAQRVFEDQLTAAVEKGNTDLMAQYISTILDLINQTPVETPGEDDLAQRRALRADLLFVLVENYITDNSAESTKQRAAFYLRLTLQPRELDTATQEDLYAALQALIPFSSLSTINDYISPALSNLIQAGAASAASRRAVDARQSAEEEEAETLFELLYAIADQALSELLVGQDSVIFTTADFVMLVVKNTATNLPLVFTNGDESIVYDASALRPQLQNLPDPVVGAVFVIWTNNPYDFVPTAALINSPVVTLDFRQDGTSLRDYLRDTEDAALVTLPITISPEEVAPQEPDPTPSSRCHRWDVEFTAWNGDFCQRDNRLSTTESTVCRCVAIGEISSYYRFATPVEEGPTDPAPAPNHDTEDYLDTAEWVLLAVVLVVAFLMLVGGVVVFWSRRQRRLRNKTKLYSLPPLIKDIDIRAIYPADADDPIDSSSEGEDPSFDPGKRSGKRFAIRVSEGDDVSVDSYESYDDFSQDESASRSPSRSRTASERSDGGSSS